VFPRALTIAGSDPSGGAGIQADLKTFTVFGVYGMSAVTALTAQNTVAVSGIVPVAGEFVRRQIDAVVTDIGVDAVKTGMLANLEVVSAVVSALREHRIDRLVVDPVMVAQSGASLLEPAAVNILREDLIPLAMLVTPNAPEAAALLGVNVATVMDLREAAQKLVRLGARAALVTGGHLAGTEAVDVLADGTHIHELRAPRIATPHTHGTGCMLSAAITAGLARGHSLFDAVTAAKRFIGKAVAAGLAIGKGNGPANPLAWDEQ
jgi:hydroxymethylpyrimidine/phosphomethylpyrimidine kinase